jgi:hypothetical protein
MNRRTRFLRILAKAGVRQWPCACRNFRATRQTELTNQFPQHVVCQWLGNSQAVANEHSLRVTDEHFAKAIKPAERALQNAVQQRADGSGTQSEQTPTIVGFAADTLCRE